MRKVDYRAFVLAFIFSVPVVFGLRARIHNPDLFYHIRTGDWILQRHTVPHTDPFAQGGTQRVFIAYSWLFDVATAKLYSAFGLMYVPLSTVLLVVAIVLALFLLIRSFGVGLVRTALLILLAMVAMYPLLYLRTWLFTILFFIVELWILFRPGGKPKTALLVLPGIFVLWANIHVQFSYGLFVLGLFVAEGILLRFTNSRLDSVAPQWNIKERALLFFVCGLATLVNPYGVGIYKVIAEYTSQKGMFPYIQETWPLNSFHPSYASCLIVTAAGIWYAGYYRERRPLVLLIFAWAMVTGFHLTRDSWVVCVASCFVIAATSGDETKDRNPIRLPSVLVALSMVLILFAGLMVERHIDSRHLAASVSANYPVAAADFIERNHLSGPLFNTYSWGGYLMWRLTDLPVSIDGRANVYGAARVERQRRTLGAASDWAQDPSLRTARLILLPQNEALTTLLKAHSCYRLAYSDSLSAVFTVRDDCSPLNCLAGSPAESPDHP